MYSSFQILPAGQICFESSKLRARLIIFYHLFFLSFFLCDII
jgi:hypothetical protein